MKTRPRGLPFASCGAGLVALFAASFEGAPARAANDAPPQPADFVAQSAGDNASGAAATTAGPFGFLSNLSQSSNALGDLGGLRPALSRFGVTLTIEQQSELLGNATGGTAKSLVYEGLTTATLQVDTKPALGIDGGLFNASGLQIHGANLSTQTLQSLQTASELEADRATRLWELWYQQKFGDRFDVKIGQQSLDEEFMVISNGAYFINSSFGWPELPTADMPAGGPAYPLSALGVRSRYQINDNLTLLEGVFNGSPVANNVGDPQLQNPSGLSFPLGQGALAIAELQWAYPAPNAKPPAGAPAPLSGVYKIGFWYDSETFKDLRYDSSGVPLASPASNGIPLRHSGDYAFYAVGDQMIYSSADDAKQNVNVFVRPMFTPLGDRNPISFSLSAGLTVHEPFPGRDGDTAGLAVDYAQVSGDASGADRDFAAYNPGTFAPVRSGETVFEATYQYQATPWLQIQPDAQYTITPGAGLANPNAPGTKIRNEAVFGVRLNAQL